MSPLETRKSLIVRLQSAQNEAAWRDFLCIYDGFLNQLIRRQGVPDRHAQDVAQQIMLLIAKSIDGWKDDGKPESFRRWLSIVSRNACIRFMSRERKHIGAVGGTDMVMTLQNIQDEPAPEQLRAYDHELIVWAAQQVRHEFIETSWQSFWRTIIEQRDVAEVAQELGVTAGSIYMSRSRIIARIRKLIAQTQA